MIKRIWIFMNNDVMRYLIAGGAATVLNFLLYAFFTRFLYIDINLSNILAIILSVIFAFFSNKYYVFRSKHDNTMALIKEFMSFTGARVVTIGLDIGGLYLFHTVFGIHDIAVKFTVGIIVIILNYLISKLFVFKKNKGIQ